ncbi:UNVERIFIED_CONTAM: hypothetical protein NY603_33845, partial [Bacteroidetes bacterium 56_B9]
LLHVAACVGQLPYCAVAVEMRPSRAVDEYHSSELSEVLENMLDVAHHTRPHRCILDKARPV